MRRRILGVLVAFNILLAGGLVVTQPAEAGFRDPCCKSDVEGNGFCAACWFTHNCHKTSDCGTVIQVQ